MTEKGPSLTPEAQAWWDDNKRCLHVDSLSGLRCVRVHVSAQSRICALPHQFEAPEFTGVAQYEKGSES